MARFSLLAGVLLGLSIVAVRADDARRLFDVTPLSPHNPAVATIDGAVTIPLSELQGYKNAERAHAIADPASLAQKRAVLDALVDEYLLVDEAYRTGVPQSPGFVKQVAATRTMILTDLMSARAIEAAQKAGKTQATTARQDVKPPPDPVTAMAARLFDQTPVDISNEAFAIVKRAAHAIDAVTAKAQRGPELEPRQESMAKLHAIVDRVPSATLATYDGKTISIQQVVGIYAGLPSPRPNLYTEQGLVDFIKPLIEPELMAIEAEKEGIAGDPAFVMKLQQNENVLLRFHMQGAIEQRANERLHAPDFPQQLQAWYDDHKADYTLPAEDGKPARLQTFDQVKERVQADYSVGVVERLKAEEVATLRKSHSVTVNEAALRMLN